MAIPTEALLKTERRFDRTAENAPEDFHDILDELERDGELIVQRVQEPYIEVMTKYGRTKKIPLNQTWHHKSCGQCGHIPGYSTAIFWLVRKLGYDYIDPTDQTSCTAWNYYASATSNAAAQAAVATRSARIWQAENLDATGRVCAQLLSAVTAGGRNKISAGSDGGIAGSSRIWVFCRRIEVTTS